MNYHDLRDFIESLEQDGELVRVSEPVDPNLEITEIADRTLRAGGPALLPWDTWFELRADIDLDAGTIDLYLDGALVAASPVAVSGDVGSPRCCHQSPPPIAATSTSAACRR